MMDGDDRPVGGGCPVMHGSMTSDASGVTEWWPKTLKLDILHQHDTKTNPLQGFDYREAVKELDFDAVKADVTALMTDSQDWWPADYGHYGGLMIRLAWHSAGTSRLQVGPGGAPAGTTPLPPATPCPPPATPPQPRPLICPLKNKYEQTLRRPHPICLTDTYPD